MTDVKLAARMAAMTESATLALNARANQIAAEGRTIYNLTAGELATDTPDFIQKAVADKLYLNKYTPVAGLPELRQAIAEHVRQFYDLDWIQPPNVVVTGGAKPALCATMLSILDPGDEVIILVPAWMVSYRPLVELAGGTVVEVPLGESLDLDVDAIKASLTSKTKAVILNSPNNPTGGVFTATALAQLAELLNERGICVIADDIYTKLVFVDDFHPVPKAGFDQLVIINGFSKSQALTGWRIGYLIAGAELAEAATGLLSHINGNAPLPSQYAGLAAMERDDQPPKTTIADLRQRRELVINGLNQAGIKHQTPAGAFYVLLDLRTITDNSAEWCEQLLVEAGVALVPGEAFAAPGYARLTFVAGEEILKPALERLRAFVEGVTP